LRFQWKIRQNGKLRRLEGNDGDAGCRGFQNANRKLASASYTRNTGASDFSVPSVRTVPCPRAALWHQPDLYLLAAAYQAGRNSQALRLAQETFRWIDQHAHDNRKRAGERQNCETSFSSGYNPVIDKLCTARIKRSMWPLLVSPRGWFCFESARKARTAPTLTARIYCTLIWRRYGDVNCDCSPDSYRCDELSANCDTQSREYCRGTESSPLGIFAMNREQIDLEN
jgi:hypothetical protein